MLKNHIYLFLALLLLSFESISWANLSMCEPMQKDKKNSFYLRAEELGRLTSDPSEKRQELVTVVGDLHGSFDVLVNALLDSHIMKLDTPSKKKVKIIYNKKEETVIIPNLKFNKYAFHDKNRHLIFMGDYLVRSIDIYLEKQILALFSDVMEKQVIAKNKKELKENALTIILGNHDLEAINGVVHPGYSKEKKFKDQITRMLKNDFITPTYSHRGIFYSHSYLTNYDRKQFALNGINFPAHYTEFEDMEIASHKINFFIKDLILKDELKDTWLGSSHMQGDHINFFYATNTPPLDLRVPNIVGHFGHVEHIRILKGKSLGTDSHVFCVDSSIHTVFKRKEKVSILKILYRPDEKSTTFFECKLPSRMKF